jgi:hypothetical protein
MLSLDPPAEGKILIWLPHSQIHICLGFLGQVYSWEGRHSEALPIFEQLKKTWTNAYGEGHPKTALAEYVAMGRRDDAMSLARRNFEASYSRRSCSGSFFPVVYRSLSSGSIARYSERKPISLRKAVGVTPTNFRNTRFNWDASLNPTASATSSIDRSCFDKSPFARRIRSDRTY